jgi:hypothetical protein
LWAGIIRMGSVWLEGQARAIADDAGVHNGAMVIASGMVDHTPDSGAITWHDTEPRH